MTHTMSIPDFVRCGWQEETVMQKLLAHLNRNKIKYRVIGTTLILFVSFSGSTHASTGIDVGARKIYKQILSVGKWIIIIKGAIDTIKSASEGDFSSAKTRAFGYILTFFMLLALPWSFDQVEKLFTEMEVSAP
ncbi:hypothetical protein PAECIP111891_06699 [Paenibacillus allorhizoplanae]|uniref:Transposase n=1 Tax=Paenibacillus allorhizoplanae TaxID=2905648 RepID=A0ABM9CYA1_9BACL|nr:hypothetical protein [Paenibacillus allorhizoplanae]CAH1230617.1 hypothetical protein PAECIP111891_06699 [Paenibacillus allorhizoplanae]